MLAQSKFGKNKENQVNFYSDISTMTDENFFGVWSGSGWTTVGKLDYTISGLSIVEATIKNGNYAVAKEALLTYYRNRTTRTMPAYSLPSDTQKLQAELEADDFCFTGDEYPLGIVDFTMNYSTVSTEVTLSVKDALSRSTPICFMLMGRDNSKSNASICSRKSSTNKPQLVVTLHEGIQHTFYPTKDAYIRAGVYETTNYGSSDFIEVEEAGNVSDNTRRAYISFEISNLGSNSIQTARLDLYGKSTAGSYSIVILNSGNTGFDESIITWKNTLGFTYTWTCVSGGNDWDKPEYADNGYLPGVIRFHFVNNIIATYQNTSEEYYAENLIRIWLDFIKDKGNDDPKYKSSLDTAARTGNMVNGYHFLKNSPSMEGEANTEILKLFWRMANELIKPENYHAESNWGVFESKGLYWVSLYFPEFKAVTESGGWLETSKSRLTSMISNMLYADGAYYESTSGYPAGVAENFKIIRELAFLNEDSFNAGFDERLLALSTYIMDFCRPDGCTPAFGDADGHSDMSLYIKEIAEVYPERKDLLYFGTKGELGEIPDHTSSMYPVGMLAFMKTGYDVNDLFMSICLADGSHAHPDLNSVTAYAYGRNLLVDPGVYSYNNDPISNWFRKETSAHNTVEIDNKALIMEDEPDYIVNINKREITEWCTNNIFDFYEGKHRAYPEFIHFRDVLFLRGVYWIVSDYITAPIGTHTYNQTWHYLPNANVCVDSATKKAKTAFGTGANIQVVPADPSNLTASIQSGFYSAWGGSYTTADYVSFVKSGSGDTTFDTILFPTQEADTNRDMRVTRLITNPGVAADTATALRIDLDYGNNGEVGYYYLSHEDTPTTARGFHTFNFNGKAAYVEIDYQENYMLAAVKKGTHLKNGCIDLISSPTIINNLGVKWNGTILDISGAMLVPDTGTSTGIAIYAPSATVVTLNGNAVSFTRIGNDIYAAKAVTGFNPYREAGAN